MRIDWTRFGALCMVPLLAAACGDGQAGTATRPDTAPAVIALSAQPADTITVYKSPTCGCCTAWVEHVREHGFAVVTHDLDNLDPVKRRLGVPAGRISCHTASVRGYTLEGHVPADLIRRMLEEKPRFRGLAVPGMPMGSPGMEGPIHQAYDVLSFDDRGVVGVYARR